MVEHCQVLSNALHCPPLSPSRPIKTSVRFQSFSSNDVKSIEAEPHTPEVVRAHGKRPAIDSPEHEPPPQRPRTDRPGFAPLDGLIVKMEETVKMLKKVRGKKDMMSDPLLGRFVSAQTELMACTAQLIMARSTKKASLLNRIKAMAGVKNMNKI